MSRELSKYHIDIAALSETRLSGITQFKEEKGGFVFYTSGKGSDEPRLSRVGFTVKSELASSLQSLLKGISHRTMTLTLDLELDTKVTLVSCYAPTMSRPDQDNVYQQLRELIGVTNHKGGVLGCHGVSKINDNGLRLLSLCRDFANTVSQQKNCRKTTWMHPRSKN